MATATMAIESNSIVILYRFTTVHERSECPAPLIFVASLTFDNYV